VDRNADRLGRATALGAHAVATTADDLDRPEGWEVVIDATGAVPAIEDGLRHVRRGGTFLAFGVTAKDAMASFSPFRVYNEELRIIGSMAVLHSFERAREVVAAGVIDGDALITHRLPLGDYADAVAAFRRGEGLKVLIDPQR
jgi:threonine dehydrogenase-like Zn-dependent dehydrogenase